jgi:hypothetical protein
MTDPGDTTATETSNDPSNTDIDQLTQALDPDDDVATRLDKTYAAQQPSQLKDAADGTPGQ